MLDGLVKSPPLVLGLHAHLFAMNDVPSKRLERAVLPLLQPRGLLHLAEPARRLGCEGRQQGVHLLRREERRIRRAEGERCVFPLKLLHQLRDGVVKGPTHEKALMATKNAPKNSASWPAGTI